MPRPTIAELQARPSIVPGVNADVEDLVGLIIAGVNPDGSPLAVPTARGADTVNSGVALGALDADTSSAPGTPAIPVGAATVALSVTGVYVGQLRPEVLIDGTWRALTVSDIGGTFVGSLLTSALQGVFEAAIPPGAAGFRVRFNPRTSGAPVVVVAFSPANYDPAPVIAGGTVTLASLPALIASAVVIGGVTKVNLVNDETAGVTATLAAAATGFGTARDCLVAAFAAVAAGNAKYPDEVRAHVSADQPFTLGIEFDQVVGFTSPDEAGNVASIAGRAGRHFALLRSPVTNRYARLYVVNNSASAMTNLRARLAQIG